MKSKLKINDYKLEIVDTKNTVNNFIIAQAVPLLIFNSMEITPLGV